MVFFFILLISQYCLVTMNAFSKYYLNGLTLFLQSNFVFFYFRILLESQKANSICSNIFSFLLANFWAITPILLPQYNKIIYIIYGFIFSIFHFYFISFYSTKLSSKILHIINNIIILI